LTMPDAWTLEQRAIEDMASSSRTQNVHGRRVSAVLDQARRW
jgi:hypothetical protein